MGRGDFKNVVEFVHENDYHSMKAYALEDQILPFRAIMKIKFLNNIFIIKDVHIVKWPLQSKIGNLVWYW